MLRTIRKPSRTALVLVSQLGLAGLLALGGCPGDDTGGGESAGDDHGHDHENESEVITTVRLTFTPEVAG